MAPTRRRVLAAVAVLAAVLAIVGCGSSSKPSSSTNSGLASANALIRYVDCMHSHGVPNFPDPSSSGSISLIGSGVDQQSPVFQAAETACVKLRPGGSAAATGADTAATLRQFLAAARCMRAHGVIDFPDPRTGVTPGSVPGLTLTGNGVSFVIPHSIDVRSPRFMHSASVCHVPGFPVPVATAPSP
jgi:hypothetical protein